MRLSFLTILSFSVFFMYACGNDSHEHHAVAQEETTEYDEKTPKFTDTFKESLEEVLDHYFSLSEALVRADAENARVHGAAFAAKAGELSAEGEAKTFWDAQKEIISKRSETLVSLQDIEEQRYQFEYISEAMIETVRAAGPLSFTVYQQRCPMVRDGSADWLSNDPAILNPYHGDRMLRCGMIVREI
jgi:Cu(I)/Ag(I) efflux system membrane fusion protein